MHAANRVAVNTVIQYIQLIVNVLVGLVSVRLILGALGKDDYGIYSLVGGVIALISFISASIAQTSVRYISVSLGTGDIKQVRETVSSCFSLHFYMSLVLVLLLELLVPLLFNGFLNIPVSRLTAAKMVYHCMVLTLFLNISNSPFNAVLYAHEKFIITSSIAILNAVLKLCIAIYISIVTSDRLIIYGLLMASITVIDVLCYQIIIRRMYPNEISFRLRRIREIKHIASFAGWTLFDTAGSMFTNQGYAILYNKFFGPAMNTVYGLSQQLVGNVYSISRSVVTTFKPQVMKSYGSGDKKRAMRLSMTAGKMGFFMMSLVAIPLIVMMPDVLDLWLKRGNYPTETIFFSRLMIVDILLEQLTVGLVFSNQAIGNVKWFSIIVSTIRMLAIPASLICFLLGLPVGWGVIMCLIFEGSSSVSRVFVMSKIAGISVSSFFKEVFLGVTPAFLISFAVCWFIYGYLKGIWGMIAVVIITAIVFVIASYYISFTKEERTSLLGIINSFVGKIKRK